MRLRSVVSIALLSFACRSERDQGAEGTGTLEVEGTELELHEGQAAFVAAHAEHRFTSYELLSLLVIFTRS